MHFTDSNNLLNSVLIDNNSSLSYHIV